MGHGSGKDQDWQRILMAVIILAKEPSIHPSTSLKHRLSLKVYPQKGDPKMTQNFESNIITCALYH